ncbi:hypothetical protein [Cellulomonas marina]|uniref:Uncharacterized protein n=1 Tax=Cellulomonas marina TaxID=988821 RepID=A0A1I0VYG9_9CELL|nr:hypothetical protein [Cellulomonas marina]SFA81238.1 hypothetical protein SAMN05421867_10240 [Cellulomonas marina]
MTESDIPLPDASVTGEDVERAPGPDSAPDALGDPGIDEVRAEREDDDAVARSFGEEGTDTDPASFLSP